MGRGGRRIVPAEYPAAWWAQVGRRLDAIAGEADPEPELVEACS